VFYTISYVAITIPLTPVRALSDVQLTDRPNPRPADEKFTVEFYVLLIENINFKN